LDQTALASLYWSSASALGVERISVVALGVSPIIGALLLIEVARLLSRRFNAWADASAGNVRRLERYAFIGSLLLGVVQAYGLAGALEDVGGLVIEPGLSFRITVVATLVAGTALLMWLATLISRHGLGGGVWLLLLAPHLGDLPHLAYAILAAVRAGAMAPAVPVALLAYGLVAVAALVALARPLAGSGIPLDRMLIWPVWMGTTFVSVLLAVPWFVLPGAPWLLPTSADTRHCILSLFSPGTLLHLALLAGLVFAVSLTQWRRVRSQRAAKPSSPPAETADALPILLTALALAAIAVVPLLLTTQLNAPILIDGRWLTALVAVALPIVDMSRRSYGTSRDLRR
jgi:preprotein translocase subunit SecY